AGPAGSGSLSTTGGNYASNYPTSTALGGSTITVTPFKNVSIEYAGPNTSTAIGSVTLATNSGDMLISKITALNPSSFTANIAGNITINSVVASSSVLNFTSTSNGITLGNVLMPQTGLLEPGI